MNTSKPNPDVNDLHAHIHCIDTSYGALFRFVEIFEVDENETPAPGDSYIVSWVSPVAFGEASGTYEYMRRPSCSMKTNFCNTNDSIVNTCNDKPLVATKGFVKSNERVYLIPPDAKIKSCFIDNNCCPYVTTMEEGTCVAPSV